MTRVESFGSCLALFGRGAFELNFRFFSRPPEAVVHCIALMVDGRVADILKKSCLAVYVFATAKTERKDVKFGFTEQ